jgi:hypothetical protein
MRWAMDVFAVAGFGLRVRVTMAFVVPCMGACGVRCLRGVQVCRKRLRRLRCVHCVLCKGR